MIDAYIVGTGVAELAAALELAEVGLSVRVAPVAAGAEDVTPADAIGVRDPEGAIRALLEHVTSPIGDTAERASDDAFAEAQTVLAAPGRTLMRAASGEFKPMPDPAIWGVPAVPMSADSIAMYGSSGALRATVDRIRPLLTIGKTQTLANLVRSRMGKTVLERGTEPQIAERFGVGADDIDVAVAAPGLNEAMTVAGTLSGGVFNKAGEFSERETLVAPAGGWSGLRAAMLRRLALYRVTVGEPVQAIERIDFDDSGLTVDAVPAARYTVREASGDALEAAAIVVGIGDAAVTVGPVAEFAATDAALRPVATAFVSTAQLAADLRAAITADGFAHGPVVAIDAVPGFAGWFARTERAGADLWRVTISGAATPAATDIDVAALFAAVLDTTPAQLAAAVWTVAPRVTTEAREAAEQQLAAERESQPAAVRVGEGLFGGELSAAVADARGAAVQLRRRLLGLTD